MQTNPVAFAARRPGDTRVRTADASDRSGLTKIISWSKFTEGEVDTVQNGEASGVRLEFLIDTGQEEADSRLAQKAEDHGAPAPRISKRIWQRGFDRTWGQACRRRKLRPADIAISMICT